MTFGSEEERCRNTQDGVGALGEECPKWTVWGSPIALRRAVEAGTSVTTARFLQMVQRTTEPPGTCRRAREAGSGFLRP
jgi:hypothetical protein